LKVFQAYFAEFVGGFFWAKIGEEISVAKVVASRQTSFIIGVWWLKIPLPKYKNYLRIGILCV